VPRSESGAVPRLSFEFFPPNTDKGRHNLLRTWDRLSSRQPEFCSVTYGAGGSTRDRTRATIEALRGAGAPAAPHLSIGMDDDDQVRALLDDYLALGVDRIIALRGDIPSGLGSARQVRYARELVRLIRDHEISLGRPGALRIEVAAYPEVHPDAPSPDADLEYLQEKVDAGADGIITQYFYNADAYFDFVDRARGQGINAPIVPGIMPITNYANLVRFSDGCGAEIPRWIRQRLAALQEDDAALKAFGETVVTRLCERLLAGGAPGLHFYTLNQAGPTLALLDRLEL
jgi:methylenetetrahydrofolate reductase (NADPH)